MTEESLASKKCIPCDGGVPKLNGEEITRFLSQLTGWYKNRNRIEKHYSFADFKELMLAVNKLASIAETEGHHPDFHVHYNELHVEIWTHKIDGLTESDFVLAAKLDQAFR